MTHLPEKKFNIIFPIQPSIIDNQNCNFLKDKNMIATKKLDCTTIIYFHGKHYKHIGQHGASYRYQCNMQLPCIGKVS
jgi:hypothetical protein